MRLDHIFSRREFIRGAAFSLGGFLLPPFLSPVRNVSPPALGRITTNLIYVYAEADFHSKRVGRLLRDQIVYLYETLHSPKGPQANPTWYRVAGGFAHSGRIQRVPLPLLENQLPAQIPTAGVLGEITVPFASSYRYTRDFGWLPLYRLYYRSVHWVMGVDQGPTGEPWYRILDQLMNAEYHVPAGQVRLIAGSEFTPTGQTIYSADKKIVVSLKDQTLKAYHGDYAVFETRVSSGIHTEHPQKGDLPTDTPRGSFHIQLKMPTRHMGDGKLTPDPQAYELPGVPWTMVFQKDGIALHGTYWHDNFGTPMSHGCVNLRNEDALWLFRWTEPVYDPSRYYVQGMGTLVEVV